MKTFIFLWKLTFACIICRCTFSPQSNIHWSLGHCTTTDGKLRLSVGTLPLVPKNTTRILILSPFQTLQSHASRNCEHKQSGIPHADSPVRCLIAVCLMF